MSDDESLYEIKNGNLILLGKPNPDLAKDTAKYITGGVLTKETKYFDAPGRIEICCKLEATKGAWPAIWLLTEKGNWPIEGSEIDSTLLYIRQYILRIHISANRDQRTPQQPK